ncbi:O-antigen ligase family protein [Blastococcus sp. SYSU DS0619]
MAIQMVTMIGIAPLAAAWVYTHRRRDIIAMASWFTASQTLSSIAGALQASGFEVLGDSSLYGRSPGLAGHPNTMGVMASVAIILALDGLRSRSRPGSAVISVVLIVNTAGLVVTGSTSAMLSLALALLVYAHLRRTTAMTYLTGAAALLLALIFSIAVSTASGAFESPVARLAQVTGQTDEVSTVADRFRTITYAWHGIVGDPLFGVGLDDASGGTFNGVVLTHNLPVRAWYQGGILAFVAILLLYTVLLGLLAAASKKRPTEAATPASIATILAVFALTSAMFQQPLYWVILSTALAVALLVVHERSTANTLVDGAKELKERE